MGRTGRGQLFSFNFTKIYRAGQKFTSLWSTQITNNWQHCSNTV